VVATWDDHDLGRNDNGASYAHRDAARAEFLHFWRGGEGAVKERGQRQGVYEAYKYNAGQPKATAIVQVIMLDCRYFRADNVPVINNGNSGSAECMPNTTEPPEYCQHNMSAGATLLGEEQWAWLEEQLLDPEPTIRIIGSSVQFAAEYHGMEAWGLHPAEQKRFIELVQTTRANGVVVISGDIHYAEISRVDVPHGYPIYDVTASGLTQDWPWYPEQSARVSEVYTPNNFGRVSVDFSAKVVTLEVADDAGVTVLQKLVPFAELRFPTPLSESAAGGGDAGAAAA